VKPLLKVLKDPSIYALIAFNIFFIYQYKDDPGKYTTIIWLYWCLSVLIGLFKFFELYTTKNVLAGDFTLNGKAIDPAKSRGCYSWFFLLHYQIFHIGYFIFLSIQFGFDNTDRGFLEMGLWSLLGLQLIHFVQNKIIFKSYTPKLSNLFFTPYLRIIPMHLTIILLHL